MSEKKTKTTKNKKVKVVTSKKRYSFPQYGVIVEADNLKDAQSQLKLKIQKENE